MGEPLNAQKEEKSSSEERKGQISFRNNAIDRRPGFRVRRPDWRLSALADVDGRVAPGSTN